MRCLCAWLLLAALTPAPAAAASRVLIIMDEREAMEVLAKYLDRAGHVESTIVDQKSAPADWSGYDAVVAYVHGALQEPIELALIDYTRKGGRYVCLHHSISSGKSANRYYFDFLGVRLRDIGQAREPATPGGHYAWRHDVDLTVVNLNQGHYITTNGVAWPERIEYKPSDPSRTPGRYPALTLKGAEVYMNVEFTDAHEKTVLLGYTYLDDRNGVLFMQDSEGWIKPSGRGWIVYLQMGHTVKEFEDPGVAQMILNAITWKPDAKR